jgi:hypothetical protein
MLRWLFKRKKLTQRKLAEREQLRRDAVKARHRAEAETALRNAKVEGYLERHPPGDGAGWA